MRRAGLLHLVVDPGAIRRPAHGSWRTRKIPRPELLVSARIVHQVHARKVIRVVLLIVAGVGDPSPIRRDLRIAVRPVSVGQRLDLESLQINRVDFAVASQIFSIGLTNGAQVNGLSIGRPIWRIVIVFARGDLPGSTAKSRVYHVDLRKAHGKRSASVGRPCQAVHDDRGSRPLGVARPLGKLHGEYGIAVRLEGGECDPLAVRRPIDSGRRLFEMSELGGFSSVHPQHVQLVCAVSVGHKRYSFTVRGPHRRAVPPGAARQLPNP